MICLQDMGEFVWSRQFQGYVLSSYFYGYLVTQILGGFLSGKYGAKYVLGTGMIIMVVMTLLTPVAARISAYLLIVLRIALGAAGVRLHLLVQHQLLPNFIKTFSSLN